MLNRFNRTRAQSSILFPYQANAGTPSLNFSKYSFRASSFTPTTEEVLIDFVVSQLSVTGSIRRESVSDSYKECTHWVLCQSKAASNLKTLRTGKKVQQEYRK